MSPDLFDPKKYASGDEGERRLWYVALTRCRRLLNVSSPSRRNKRPTIYLKEIQHDIVARDDSVSTALPKATPVPPANAELLPTTYTELSYYWRCPFEYQLRALMGFEPGVRESYGYGQQIHNVLAEVHQSALNGNPLSTDKVSQIVDQRFHLRYTSDGEEYKPLTQLKKAAKQSIMRYLENYPDTTRFVVDAEKPFEFIDKDTGALISGTVDLIQRIKTTTSGVDDRIPVALVDFKAHRWRDADSFLTRRKEVEAQLRLYAVAAGHEWGFMTEAAYAHFLSPNPPSADLLHQGVQERVSIDVSDEARRAIQHDVRDAVTNINNAIQSGTFDLQGVSNGTCPRCDFREICPGYRHWQQVDRTTPRPGSPESERELEIAMIATDLNAG